jgi:hypothetical protein
MIHNTQPILSNLICQIQDGRTALFLACENGNLQIVNILLEYQPNLFLSKNVCSFLSFSLHLYSLFSSHLFSPFSPQPTPNPHLTHQQQGEVPLQAAQKSGHSQIVQLLSNQISSNQLSSNQLYANPILSKQILSKQILAKQILANPISSNQLYANPISSNAMLSNAVHMSLPPLPNSSLSPSSVQMSLQSLPNPPLPLIPPSHYPPPAPPAPPPDQLDTIRYFPSPFFSSPSFVSAPFPNYFSTLTEMNPISTALPYPTPHPIYFSPHSSSARSPPLSPLSAIAPSVVTSQTHAFPRIRSAAQMAPTQPSPTKSLKSTAYFSHSFSDFSALPSSPPRSLSPQSPSRPRSPEPTILRETLQSRLTSQLNDNNSSTKPRTPTPTPDALCPTNIHSTTHTGEEKTETENRTLSSNGDLPQNHSCPVPSTQSHATPNTSDVSRSLSIPPPSLRQEHHKSDVISTEKQKIYDSSRPTNSYAFALQIFLLCLTFLLPLGVLYCLAYDIHIIALVMDNPGLSTAIAIAYPTATFAIRFRTVIHKFILFLQHLFVEDRLTFILVILLMLSLGVSGSLLLFGF